MKTNQPTPHAKALDLQAISDTDEELLDAECAEWFKSITADMTPGKVLRAYRTRENLTQEDLGEENRRCAMTAYIRDGIRTPPYRPRDGEAACQGLAVRLSQDPVAPERSSVHDNDIAPHPLA